MPYTAQADGPDNTALAPLLATLSVAEAVALFNAQSVADLTLWEGYRPQIEAHAQRLREAAEALAAQPVKQGGAGADGLDLIRQAAAGGRFRIAPRDHLLEADPDAGAVWPIEIELPCINGLSCWFPLGSLYTPDAAARGYTDGALSDELTQAFAEHIERSLLAPAPTPPAGGETREGGTTGPSPLQINHTHGPAGA